jgi:hypothetical protein
LQQKHPAQRTSVLIHSKEDKGKQQVMGVESWIVSQIAEFLFEPCLSLVALF